jgi:hypothetical protein
MRVKRKDRLPRTVLLGALLVGAAIYWLADVFEIDRAELLDLLSLSLILVGSMAALGVVGAVVLMTIRKLLSRNSSTRNSSTRKGAD